MLSVCLLCQCWWELSIRYQVVLQETIRTRNKERNECERKFCLVLVLDDSDEVYDAYASADADGKKDRDFSMRATTMRYVAYVRWIAEISLLLRVYGAGPNS